MRIFFETPPKNSTNMLFSHFFTYTSDSWSKSFRKCQVSIFRCYLGCAPHTQSWVFFQNGKNPAFLLLYYSANKKSYSKGLYMRWERISCRLNTKRPLSVIWLLRYKQNSFGCFLKKLKFRIFPKTPKTVLLISQWPNITQRPFCIKNELQGILDHLI